MKLVSLQATNRHTNQRQFFKFDLPTSQKRVATSSTDALDSYLKFCFDPNQTGDFDVAFVFEVDGQTYRLQKTFDGQDYKTQLFATFAHSQSLVQEGNEALNYVQNHFDVNLADLCNNAYVSNQALAGFNGELSCFDNVYQLHLANLQQQDVALVSDQKVTEADLQQVNAQLAQTQAQLSELRNQIAEIKGKLSQNAVVAEVASQIALLTAEQEKLSTNSQIVQNMRDQLQTLDSLVQVVPKFSELEALTQQKAQYQAEYDQAQQQLSWQEAELKSISEQLSSKQSQTEVALGVQSKIDVINHELQVIATLHETNKQLAIQLEQLSKEKALLLADKEIFTNKLVSIENEIAQCKQRLDVLHAPDKSVTDLLEGVKIDTKLEEIVAQIDICKTELALKENLLSEKENTLLVQVKRFRSVAEVDVSVAPVKAKDTILQVLETKYSKLEAINKSLAEKLRNLQRMVEDYRYRIAQLDSSKNKLDAEFSYTQKSKQEAFKREVYLNAQRSFEDASAVYAVTTQLDDVETETLRQELLKRTTDRDFLVQKASQLEGRIAEIKRHMAINDAEMKSLRTEKGNINDHYNQIVSQNHGEAVFNYLKALESNNGTKYLLDVQQDAVKSQAEIEQIKASVEALRSKIQALTERQARLVENRSHLCQVGENTVATNYQLKDELTIVADNLSAHYSLYQSIRQQLDQTEASLLKVISAEEQLNNQLLYNESLVEKSTQRATEHAGTTNLEQAVADFKYQVADVSDETEMLQDAFNIAQKEVFKRRLQAEKLQWLLANVTNDYNALYTYVTEQLAQRGVDMQTISLGAINKHSDQMRQAVAKYESKQGEIQTKLSYLQGLIAQHNAEINPNHQEQLHQLVQSEQDLIDKLQRLQHTHQQQVEALLKGVSNPAPTPSNTAVSKLVKTYLGKFLSVAQENLCATVPNCTLQMVGDVVQVYKDGSLLSYSQMSNKQKAAVYLALLTSSWQDQTGRWVIIDEIAGVTKSELTQMLSATNVHYVVAYTVINKEKKQ